MAMKTFLSLGVTILFLHDLRNFQVLGFSSVSNRNVLPELSALNSPRSLDSKKWNSRKSKVTSPNMVIDRKGTFRVPLLERLSNECIEAVKEAHDIGNGIGLDRLRNEVLFAGVVANPERARKTLEKA